MATQLGEINTNTPVVLGSEVGAVNGVASLDATGKVPSSQLAGGGKSMVVSFAAGADMELNTSTIGYVARAQFIYAGSTTVGPIIALKANIWKNSAIGATGQIKIVDITNGLDIATLTGVENLFDATVLDLGTITNVPTGPAVFEVQMGRSAGANRVISLGTIEIVY
jgi:hypothetical protein